MHDRLPTSLLLLVLLLTASCASNTHDSATPSDASQPPQASAQRGTSGAAPETSGTNGPNASQPPPPPERPPEPPFPEVEANPAVPRVAVQDLKASGLCGRQDPIQVTGYVTEFWTCKCVTVDGRTVCDNMCIEIASIRERADLPKDEGIAMVLPHPSRDLFEENGHYVVEGLCLMTKEPNPKIQSMVIHARSRLP